jgi:hypothetical protein
MDAVRYYARAVRAGDAGSLGRAMIALLDPGYASKRLRVGQRQAPDAWIDEALIWLAPLVANEASPQGRH